MPSTLRRLVPCVVAGCALGLSAATQASGFDLALDASPPQEEPSAPPLSAGFDHDCGLTASGEAYCWGSNDMGELGQAPDTLGAQPDTTEAAADSTEGESGARPSALVRVGTNLSFDWISASHNRTCGLVDGAAMCWGRAPLRALGDSADMDPWALRPIGGEVSFATLSAGSDHACGLTAEGEAYCWGSNRVGELGDGTNVDRREPVRVRGELRFESISVGFDHTCGLTDDEEAWCWGSNESGELGGEQRVAGLREPIAVMGDHEFEMISAGQNRTCALTDDGEAYCWGSNAHGALGDGTDTLRTSPVRVHGDLSFESISVGYLHTCALTEESRAYCWGFNGFGQVGDGTTDSRSEPTVVLGELSFRAISAGAYHTCAVTVAGEAYCWGRDPSADLGASAGRLEPTRIPGRVVFG